MFNDDGLWNDPSTDEARINSFQFSQLTNGMLRGATMSSNPELVSTQSIVPLKRRVKPIRPSNTSHPSGLRTYNDIVNSDAYTQPDYQPRPMKIRTDHEKDRLANIMAYGTDPSKMPRKPNDCLSSPPPPPPRQIDRFEELVLEVEERKEFLEHMTVLGKRKEYREVISNEIADV
ncbi:hypothetical protein I4U23_007578 [Adineta vaga]|nr:hypothetical protein I4U23_007578 [Adineta vaga]